MFSMDTNVTYKGKVVEYQWVNPHSHIVIKVDPGAGVDPADGRHLGHRGRQHQHHGPPGMEQDHVQGGR